LRYGSKNNEERRLDAWACYLPFHQVVQQKEATRRVRKPLDCRKKADGDDRGITAMRRTTWRNTLSKAETAACIRERERA
jgi:hypothetical protein